MLLSLDVAAMPVQKKSAIHTQTLPSTHSKAVSSKMMRYSAGSKRSSSNADDDAIVASVRRRVTRDVTEQKQWQLMEQSATKIAAAWRGFCAYACYQCDLLAIIIVQIFVHSGVARIIAEQKWRKLMVQSVTIVQSFVHGRVARIIDEQKWRGHELDHKYHNQNTTRKL